METAILPLTHRLPVTLSGGNDHPVVDLPFSVRIDGRQLRGHGLSLVAAHVSGLLDPAVLNTTRIVRLAFQFDGFAVTLVVDAMVRDLAPGSGEAELVFVQPTGPHLPQLRHILNAYIAGDLVGLGQTIAVAGTAAPKDPKGASEPQRGRVAGVAAITLLSLALATVAGTLAYQRMFITLLPAFGTVVSSAEVMRATTTGQIVLLDPLAGAGDVAIAIRAASGDVQSLLLPCDCRFSSNGLREGSTVLIGEPVLSLSDADDHWLVAAEIPAAVLFEMGPTDRIELTFPDGATAFATPEPFALAGLAPGELSRSVLLRPDTPLDPDRAGAPVRIRILDDIGLFGGWLDLGSSRIATFMPGA